MARHTEKHTLRGYFQLHPKGFGFVVPSDPQHPDIFVPSRYTGGALHRDEVTVEYWRSAEFQEGRGKEWEGRIVTIHQRGMTRLVGRFEQNKTGCRVIPDNERFSGPVQIPADGTGGARQGQAVAVMLLGYPSATEMAWGKVIQILGTRGELATEIEAVIHHHDLPLEFPEDVEAAAQQMAGDIATTKHLEKDRRDLRALHFVTIDGESAKDFDDAVAVESLPQDRFRVWVAIADVSAFVPVDSLIDKEALRRGTSVYFPDRALPMLPHVLSDHYCSLRPNEDRLVLVAEFEVHADGSRHHSKFYRGVIRSRARLTYTIVHRLLEGHDPALQAQYALQQPLVELMAKVCRRLRTVRFQRGSLNLDLPEPQIELDIAGEPGDIFRAPRYFSHQMIEDLMIAANEEVAEFLTNRGFPCMYRVHPKPAPERIRMFRELLDHLGYPTKLKHPARPHDLSKVIEQVRGQPEERLVNHMLLRSMQQAYYSLDNDGHFGLASTCYCHFTSPIRRYPDLMIHRVLIEAIGDTKKKGSVSSAVGRLRDIAAHTSRRERIAMEAEREMLKVYSAAFLRGHLGKTFDGVITHLTKFGFFVELIEYFVEGLVHLTSLTDDRYQFDEAHHQLIGRRRKKTYRIGDKVRIVVHDITLEGREARFLLVEE